MSRFNLRDRVAELVGTDTEPDAKSFDQPGGTGPEYFTVESEDFDRTEPPDDEMEEYWRQYETTPIIRKPISSFASQVMEPGYYIEAKHLSREDIRELERWLEHCAIIEGEIGQDWRNLAKKTIIQQEVRGTAIIEKVPAESDEDKLAGFKLLNPETVEVVTRPNQSILLAPDDTDVYEDVPTTDDDEAAAYLQDISETNQTRWGAPIEDRYDGMEKVAFTREEIIKITRDADVGEVYGTARVEAVSDRVQGLKQKLEDNDEAIASKAYPLWLFLFGTEDNPWEVNRINEFMKRHETENFHPGMKQGVRGDVDIKTISGEVADIAEYLQFDIDYIISSMPMPKYALGGFGESVGQVAGVAQQQDVQRQINEARRELESNFTAAIQEKAEELGFDDPEDVHLRVGSRQRADKDPDSNESIIRYIGSSDSPEQSYIRATGEEDELPPNVRTRGEPEDGESSDGSGDGNGDDAGTTQESEQARHVWDTDTSIAELEIADRERSRLADEIYETMTEARDSIFESTDSAFMRSDQYVTNRFERDADRAMQEALRSTNVTRVAEDAISDEVEDVANVYNLDRPSGFARSQQLRFYTQNVKKSVEDSLEEFMRQFRTQLRRAVESGDSFTDARMRLQNHYDDSYLRSRAELIAQMELKRATESEKLRMFENADNVVGVEVDADGETRICESLDCEVVRFSDDRVHEQLEGRTADAYLHAEFDPLPETPPFHYGCETSYEPVYSR